MGLIILAILLFYVRVFPNKWMRLSVYALTAFVIAWTLAMVIVVIFQCTPVQFFWNREIARGHCINANDFYFAMAVVSTVVLVAVLFLPAPTIWKLQVSHTKRMGLAFVFTIGVLYVIFRDSHKVMLGSRVDGQLLAFASPASFVSSSFSTSIQMI